MPGGCPGAEATADDGSGAGAFHQDVRCKAFKGALVGMIGRAEIAYDRFLRAPLVVIEHVHVKPALLSHQGGEQADRARAGDEQAAGFPYPGALADALGVVPRLGKNARRLQQHAQDIQSRIDLDHEFRLDAEAFGAVTVPLLDPALGVAAVAAHVPFAGGTSRARLRIGPADDPDDEVAGRDLAIRGRAFHRPQRLMAEDKAPLAGRRGAVGPHEDFTVGRANPERARAHQNRSVRERRFGHIVEPGGIGDSGQNRDCAHPVLSVDGLDFIAGGAGMRYSAG